MDPKNILVFYKASAYEIYFLNHLSRLGKKIKPFVLKHIRRSHKAHDEHYASLKKIEQILKKFKVPYAKRCRGKVFDRSPYDLVITVGGDGTFLEAARGIDKQMVIGINSDPDHSVGKLCVADVRSFEKIWQRIRGGRFKICSLQRLRLKLEGQKNFFEVLNDILVCHKNPAMMCRYYLQIKGKGETQQSSGIWISTAAGSSGAIQSAGGKLLRTDGKKFQYMPRELYEGNKGHYHLRGGVLNSRENISITSLMTGGMIFIDGAHLAVPFEYGSTLTISFSPRPIKTIKF